MLFPVFTSSILAMHRRAPTLTALAAALALGLPAAHADTVTEAELARRVDQLSQELQTLKAQLAQLQQQQAATATRTVALAPAPSATTTATPLAAAPPADAATGATGPATVLTSYGEINLNRPTSHSQDAQADLRRFVLGLEHRFDERTKLVSELEVEHAVASSSDQGEVEVEQAYIERQFTQQWAARAGLFLMPVGLLNENHEPTAYYGVERNFVETAIIPTTWREGGVQAIGSFDSGWTLQAGLSTGFDIAKWDFSDASEGRASPLGSIHQELQLARAHDLAAFGAANWRGIPGLQLGGSVFTGNASQGPAGWPQARVTLWDAHARWTPGRWDLAALFARGSISNTAALNLLQAGAATPIPSRFDGAYVQAAYTLWSAGDQALRPFARWELYNTAQAYADLGPGITPQRAATEHVGTVGANYQVTPEIVLKADYQRFSVDSDNNRVDLGLGWSF
jgi:outer membrane murein-binding lipoprotein Lpp